MSCIRGLHLTHFLVLLKKQSRQLPQHFMPKKFHKHKLLLDENMSHRDSFPTLNSRFNIKHIAADLKKCSLPDPEVYELACKEQRLLVTYNVKDFKSLIQRGEDAGIIGVSPNLSLEQIDKKINSLLTKATKKELFGKLTMVSVEE